MANAGDDGEIKTAVASLSSVFINPYCCCTRCARKRKTRYLPLEIVFKILLHFPAQVIHDVMRHVCREWNFMIRTKNFIYDHLRNSTGGIIIQYWYVPRYGIYVEMRRGCLEICRFDSGLKHLVGNSCNGLVLDLGSSCNGLVLDLGFGDSRILYVTNPLTTKRAILPSLVQKVYPEDFALAFVESSMKYKVVHTDGSLPFGIQTQIAVLTIGVDKVWRHIDIEHISLPAREALRSSPLVTGGYVHWIRNTFVLTLNVETEIICQFAIPQLPKYFLEHYSKYLPMGCNLSLIYGAGKYLRDVWEMNPEAGEWTLVLSFDLEPLTYIFKDLRWEDKHSIVPLGWLAGREVFLFYSRQRLCIAYNVQTRKTQSFELENWEYSPHSQAHVNSLVWLE